MIWKETKNPLGNDAMIFYNSEDGTISSDPAYRMFCCGEGLNELFNSKETPGIYVRKNSGIHEKCGIWVENGNWYPIIQMPDGSALIAYFADWEGTEHWLEDRVFRESYENCQRLAEIVRNELGGDAEEPDKTYGRPTTEDEAVEILMKSRPETELVDLEELRTRIC